MKKIKYIFLTLCMCLLLYPMNVEATETDTNIVTYTAGEITDGEYKEPAREIYTFAGWYLDKECTDGNEFDPDSDVIKLDEDTRIYAKWVPAPKIVTYYVDDEVTYTEEVEVGSSVLSPTTFTPTKEGYTFVGWTESTDPNSEVLSEKVAILEDSYITLYAIFKKDITVTCISHDNTKTITDTIYFNGSGNYDYPYVTLPEGTEYVGWTWRGWSDGSTESNADVFVTNGQVISVKGISTIYGLYEKTVTLSYDGNGADSGSVESQSAATNYYNAAGNYLSEDSYEFVLAENGFVKDGRTFIRWDLGQPGETITLTESATAYAQWDAYYSSLYTAVNDINNGTIGENADTDEANAGVGVCVDEEGEPILLLKKDLAETAKVKPTTDMTIKLNGHELTSTQTSVMDILSQEATITIDGRTAGSKMCVLNGTAHSLIQSRGNVVIQGGTYILQGQEPGTNRAFYGDTGTFVVENAVIEVQSGTVIDSYAVGIQTATGCLLSVSNCDITVLSTGENISGYSFGIYGTNITVTNCDINVTSETGAYGETVGIYGTNTTVKNCDITAVLSSSEDIRGFSLGIRTAGDATITNSNIKALSDYRAYTDSTRVQSVGICTASASNVTITNSNVYGVHSGISSAGSLTVDGGTYEGFAHGGLYASSTGSTVYVKNATLREASMPDGYASPYSNGAGMYIGGKTGMDNITVYMDNCDVYGSKQGIVLRGTDGEQNNTLYISNSNINPDCTDHIIRADNETHKVYIGVGNNFTADDVTPSGTVVTTEDEYIQIIDEAIQNN